MTGPEVSVVVASHGRLLRLRWLLNALEQQTLPCEAWEVVVVHDYPPEQAGALLDGHPLAAAGRLRHLAIPPAEAGPARQRNLGWRMAQAQTIAFVDDDCRPEPGWLEALVAAGRRHPGAIVQGATRPDPYEELHFAAPHVRSLAIDPPGPYAQTCNILYPRTVLEGVGGFDERAVTGEDIDLHRRAIGAGAGYVGAPEALVLHAVESFTALGMIAQKRKWRHLAYLAKRHPEIRRRCVLGIFWKPEHFWISAGLLGVAVFRRPALVALAAPYLVPELRRRGSRWRDRLVAAAELPSRLLVEVAEIGIFAWGSVEHRSLLL